MDHLSDQFSCNSFQSSFLTQGGVPAPRVLPEEGHAGVELRTGPSTETRVNFSTKDDVHRRSRFTDKRNDTTQRLAFFTPFNIAVMLLTAGLAVALVFLQVRSWRNAVDLHNARLADSFESAVESHVLALREALEAVESRMLQYDAFLQQIRTLESLRAFASREQDFSASVMWLPHVLHSERSAFVAETTAIYRSFFNDTAYTMNVTDLVYTDGRITGMAASKNRSEYFPIQLLANVDVIHPLVPGVDLNSEPSRARVLATARQTRDVAVSSRIINVNTGSVSGFMARPVYEAANASHLLGMLVVTVHPVETVSAAASELAPASLRLRVFDVTGESVDDTGCLRPILFDGERDGTTGAWEAMPIEADYCPSDPHELASSEAVTATAAIAQHEWLLIFERGATFDGKGTSISLDLVMLSSLLAALTVLLIVGVLTRGWWMMGVLRESQQRELKSSRQSKSFLAFVTHELRNPLFALMGTSGELSALAEEEQCSSGVTSLISSVEVSAERMSTILDDVLSMRKLEEGKLELDESPTSLKDVARELHAMFSPRAKASGVKLRSFVRRDVPGMVVMDSGRVVQVVSNFLSNAIKFTMAGGMVELYVQSVDAPDWYRRDIENDTKSKRAPRQARIHPAVGANSPTRDNAVTFIRLEVRDTGKGISEEEMGRLFQPYMQASAKTAREHGGTGLGLYICKQLVESMGGEVTVTSHKGVGSTFAAVLPLVEDYSVDRAERVPQSGHNSTSASTRRLSSKVSDRLPRTLTRLPTGTTPGSQSGAGQWSPLTPRSRTPRAPGPRLCGRGPDRGRRTPAVFEGFCESPGSHKAHPLQQLENGQGNVAVLIVDDQAINRRILGNLFRRLMPFVDVRYAEDGADALEDVQQRGDDYLLVLMDVVMPVMDGRASVRAMRARGLDLPVIAVTGGVSKEEMDANWEAGFSDVLVKPLRRAQLLGLVSKYLRVQATESPDSG